MISIGAQPRAAYDSVFQGIIQISKTYLLEINNKVEFEFKTRTLTLTQYQSKNN